METKFGVGVGLLEWLEDEGSWSLNGLDGQNLGHFKGVVASDKNVLSKVYKCNWTTTSSWYMTAFLSAVSSKLKCRQYVDCDIIRASFKDVVLKSIIMSNSFHRPASGSRISFQRLKKFLSIHVLLLC